MQGAKVYWGEPHWPLPGPTPGGIFMAGPEAKIKQMTDVMDQLIEDNSVPRNIRRGADNAKKTLLKAGEALDVRVAGAVSILDDLANDPNIPLHGRTLIWNIISSLETMTAK